MVEDETDKDETDKDKVGDEIGDKNKAEQDEAEQNKEKVDEKMKKGEKKVEKGGNVLDTEFSVNSTDLNKIYAVTPARFDAQRYSLYRITFISVSGLYKITAGIPFSLKYINYMAKTWHKIIKKTFGCLINFIF